MNRELIMIEFLKAMLVNNTSAIDRAPNHYVQLARELADKLIKESK